MKKLLWEVCAAMVREILQEKLTAEEFRADIKGQMDKVVKLLEAKNPELFNSVKSYGNSDQNLAADIMEFYGELFGALGTPTSSTIKWPDTFGVDGLSGAGCYEVKSGFAPSGSVFVTTGAGVQPVTYEPSVDEKAETEDCRCPNLLIGHLRTCALSKESSLPGSIQKELESKLGPFASYGKNAVFYAADDDQVQEAEKLGMRHSSELQQGDLIFVEESTSGELADYRNVQGPWVGLVIDLEPYHEDCDSDGDFQAAVVDPLGNPVSKENLWLTSQDRIFILQRNHQTD